MESREVKVLKQSTLQRWFHKLMCLPHFRGHGVHSPFVYKIVRRIFMARDLLRQPTIEVVRELYFQGVRRRPSIEIENLCQHLGFSRFVVDKLELGCVVICTPECSDELCEEIAQHAEVVIVLAPYLDSARKALCHKIITECQATSVDRYDYLAIFNNNPPKQHFKL